MARHPESTHLPSPTWAPFLLAIGLAASCAFGAVPPAIAAGPDFVNEVKPILEQHCVRCHGAGRDKGGLRLHQRDLVVGQADSSAVVVPGDSRASELLFRIQLPAEDNEVMPQESKPLSAANIATLRNWIESGAHWPDGVRLQPVRRDKIAEAADRLLDGPAPETAQAVARQLDRTIHRVNQTDGTLTESEPVDDLAFLRRVTIDLIGRIPTIEEIERFEALPSHSRRIEWIDHLLDHPRFIDRWTVFFADMLRIRSNQTGGNHLLAFVRQSLTERVPYDEMVRQMISASGRPQQNPATGFILADNANPLELAGITAQVFLGVRLACAECHDHPFDDWTRKQFYEFAAFFGQTRRFDNNFANATFITDDSPMRVQWPPEDAEADQRQPVDPHFPLVVAAHGDKPAHHIERLRKTRAKTATSESSEALDNLLDRNPDRLFDSPADAPDVLAEARDQSRRLKVEDDLHGSGELRSRLAERVTNPQNPYFSRAFANRIWHQLIGRGFVEPVDNLSPYADVYHPAALELLAREFVAGGYDLRHLVRTIVLTDTYARSHGPANLEHSDREHAERSFATAVPRRMISEVLFDSILVGGHLLERKWEPGANVRNVTRQIRVPIVDESPAPSDEPDPPSTGPAQADPTPMMSHRSAEPDRSYDLERGIEIDFDAILNGDSTRSEIEQMRMQEDRELQMKRDREQRMEARAADRPPQRYRLETVVETIDDNPVFPSTMRMATPAPPSHFLRVFGQPSRQGLGEFRDHSPSLRQQLMLLNGRATHEAARVGTLEPLHALLTKPDADIRQAVRHAYRELLTRNPTTREMQEALAIIDEAESPLDGMADLRWALLNCHEFRYLP